MQTLGTLPTKVKFKVKPVIILRIVQVLTLLIFIFGLYGIFVTISKYKELEPLTSTLSQTSLYPVAKNSIRSGISTVSSDQKNQFLKTLLLKNNLAEVVELNKTADLQFVQTQNYVDSVQMPYDNLLHYLLMPPLNIWKNKFTGKIDDTLIGQKYLTENSYLDVNLISKWTNFFKDIGKDSPKNEIKTIDVGEIKENPTNNTFTITIDVTFVAQTKRSFLLLVDKLSSTSNKENLGLMNEFFFNLRSILKEKTGNQGGVTSGGALVISATGDQFIGTNMFKWIQDPSSNFITNQDIDNTIKRFANCENEEISECYFKFREKIRNLPSIAYTIGMPNANKTKELRTFLQNIPPLINVKGFTFRKMNNAAASKEEVGGYEGTLQIEAYGKSMNQGEIDEIAAYLGSVCLSDASPLSPGGALTQLERTIKQATQISQFSNKKSQQLNDLRSAIQDITKLYGGKTGLQKVIALFELYRMLLDNSLCTPKK